ncbi:MAG: patatin-like phospholipase family protein, partial [Silvanigrellales bacterium]|nr:patatin-like phospholipase family protein [Silvanigrellales bacterium]
DPKLSTVAKRLGSQVWFLSNAFDVANVLPRLDADLVIVDERLFVPSSTPTSGKRREPKLTHVASPAVPRERPEGFSDAPGDDPEMSSQEERRSSDVLMNIAQGAQNGTGQAEAPRAIVFEDVWHALQKFTPRDFHFPARRILVILPKGDETAQRSFQLGLANVRRVMIAPHSSVELFLFATRQIADFRDAQTKTSLCVSGGGLEGYIYAVGVSHALEECFATKTNNDFDIYCGVSSGAILTLSLAAGLPIEDVVAQLYKRKGRLEPLQLSVIFDFAGGEIVRRVLDLIRGVSTLDPGEIVARIQRTIPVGFFRGDRLKTFIERQLKRAGIVDNLSALPKELYISATDQDTGEHVVFGEEPWRDIRASAAVRASTALPPFYLPERINGHWFSDGQLTSSSDFNTAIRKGARLVVLIDPMVAYTSAQPGAVMKHGGYFTAVQAIKSLVQTRSQSFLKHSMDVHPDVDFVVFRPTDEVMEAMAGNPMRYRIRTELAELGYKGTLMQVLSHYDAYAHRFGKHGFALRPEAEIRALLERS